MDQVKPAIDAVTSIADTVNSVLTMSSSGAIIKIVLLILTFGFTIWMTVRKKNVAIEDARKEEGHADNVNHNTAVKQNTNDNQQVATDSKRIDDLFKGDKNG